MSPQDRPESVVISKRSASITVTTLGCKVNQYDSAALCALLKQDGYVIVPFPGPADICIVNTCAVTGGTEAQSRQVIRRILREYPGCQVVVTGCYAQTSPGDVCALSDRVHVIGNKDKDSITRYVASIARNGTRVNAVTDIAGESLFTTAACTCFSGRTRALLKIQDGCNGRCSYCIVPAVRGPSRSLPIDEVRDRIAALIESGYREIVLTGIHLGSYGLDLSPRTTISRLLERLEADHAASSIRIRLSSIEPNEFTDNLIKFLAQSRIVCPHLHIPLQSGDATILKAMRRPYTPQAFHTLLAGLLDAIPEVNIGLDVLVGFPGETEQQFQNTLAFMNRYAVGYAHVFPYSRRQGTAAACLANQVPDAVKKARVQEVRKLAAQKKYSFIAAYRDRRIAVLIENRRDKKTGLLKGMTRNYIPVLVAGPESLIGQEVTVQITEVLHDSLAGTVLL